MANVLVLGAGLVGSVIAADLAATKGFRVTVADRSAHSLGRAQARSGGRTRAIELDCADPGLVVKQAAKADVVVGALPSVLGFRTLEAMAKAGKRYCDISFMPEDFLSLDAIARRSRAICVADMGVAPGMSNVLAGHGVDRLSKAEHLDIMVGGIPRLRRWPFDYKAGFAPADVLEEYVRPSRVIEAGRIVVKEALSEPEYVDFEGIGTLEAFNTDGLRSLLFTLKVPFMRERTLRYPGHIELMRAFRATGLFSLEPISVGGVQVRPRDVLAMLLFPKWTYEEGEEDLTVMRVVVEGTLDGARSRLTWDLFDHMDRETGFSSMSRTTAFPCTSVARMLLDGTIDQHGVHAPERLVTMQGVFDRLIKDLRARGIEFRASVETESTGRRRR